MVIVDVALAIIVLFGILSFLVLIHELGHFLSARRFGVRVEEFGIGYPPRAKKLFTKDGVEYTLNWLPVGGFVRLAGEMLDEEEKRNSTDSGLFYNNVWWKKLIVILAGAVVNFVYGILAFGVLFSVLGIPSAAGVQIFEVAENSPAQEVGLEPGMLIEAVRVDGREVEVNDTAEFVNVVGPYEGNEVILVLSDDGEELEREVYVRRPSETPDGDGAIGIAIEASELEFVKHAWWQMPFRGAWYGLQTAFEFSWMVLGVFRDMFTDIFTQAKVPDEVSGPIGIVYQAYDQDILQEGIIGLINWSAVLSIQLAIINVLPIPAMDGGRALFILIEKAMGKRYRLEYEQKAIIVGMLFLLGLIILVSIKDLRFVLMDTGIL